MVKMRIFLWWRKEGGGSCNKIVIDMKDGGQLNQITWVENNSVQQDVRLDDENYIKKVPILKLHQGTHNITGLAEPINNISMRVQNSNDFFTNYFMPMFPINALDKIIEATNEKLIKMQKALYK